MKIGFNYLFLEFFIKLYTETVLGALFEVFKDSLKRK